MNTHNWTQKDYIPGAFLEGLTSVTAVQEYKCTRCGSVIALPDCYHNGKQRVTCKTLMMFGCTNEMPEKEKWKAPIKKREYEEKRDYPKKKGAKK